VVAHISVYPPLRLAARVPQGHGRPVGVVKPIPVKYEPQLYDRRKCRVAQMRYVNPFWHRDRVMVSDTDPGECRRRLRAAPTSLDTVGRLWIGRGDVNFCANPNSRMGSLFEMHVRVTVAPKEDSGSLLHLRFSGGVGSAIALSVAAAGCALAFVWALHSVVSGAPWRPIYGGALLAILLPILLVFAFRSEAADDEQDLCNFIAGQVGGHTQ